MKEFDQKWLQKVDEIIENQLDNSDFVLDDLATALSVSPAKLHRTLTKLTGESPKKYIRMKRLNKAKNLLERGVYPTVSEVAIAVGYRHFYHFSIIYEEAFGKKPIDYLK